MENLAAMSLSTLSDGTANDAMRIISMAMPRYIATSRLALAFAMLLRLTWRPMPIR